MANAKVILSIAVFCFCLYEMIVNGTASYDREREEGIATQAKLGPVA